MKRATDRLNTPRTLGNMKAGQAAISRKKLILEVWINGNCFRTLLDSGADCNFMSPQVVNQHQISWKDKQRPYDLVNPEGEAFTYNQGRIDRETDQLSCTINGSEWPITFDIMHLEEYDAILGIPWLCDANPVIDWRTGHLEQRKFSEHQHHELPEAVKLYAGTNDRNRRTRRAAKKTQHRLSKALTAMQPDTATPYKQERIKRRTLGLLKQHLGGVKTYMDKKLQEHQDKPKQGRMDHIPQQYHRYDKLFAEQLETKLPQHSQWDHEIELIDGSNPTISKIYPLNETQLETLRDYLNEMLELGYIRRSKSPAGYPVMFVPKKNGKLRLVVDYRRLNEITKKDRTPLPLTNELKDRLIDKKWFTALDLKGAYNLIRMKEGDEWKTAFRTKYGLYEYLVMPFGLTNAPATFQRMINTVLSEYLDVFVVVYLDDILIFSEDEKQHQEHVHKVLNKLQDANLLVDPDKSKFHQHEVEFLGHIIRPGEIAMEPAKVQAVREWKEPESVKETQGFLGFANYYRRFIKDFSKIAAPMTNATKKNDNFKWTKECGQAFEQIKEMISSEPVLIMFDPKKPAELETDASDFAVAGQLGQRDEQGRLHPVAFFSRKLQGAELNYPIYDKEFMAIVLCFEEFRHYLQGSMHKVKVYTDHKNIAYFTTTQQLNKRQLRYAETMAEFDYEILHRKGSENGRADAMSRRADYNTGQPVVHGQVFKIQDGVIHQQQLNALKRIKAGKSKEKILSNPLQEKEFNELNCEIGPKTNLQPYQRMNYEETIEAITKPGYALVSQAERNKEAWKLTTHQDGTIMYNNKIWIPSEDLALGLVQHLHQQPDIGHPGITKMTNYVQRTYDRQGLKSIVTQAIKQCHECKLAKSARHKPYGQLQPLPVAERPWGSIAFDHIVKLPESKKPGTEESYNSIFVITDRLTKYGYFIPYNEASDATTLAYHFLDRIVSQHGLPDEIISDRGTTFTSKFWQALMALIGVKHKLSTAFHPTTDGQTERLNQTLEQYLRCYVNYDQDDWVKWLPTAQFAYNTAYQESTRLSPFYANYGFNPEIHRTPRKGPLAEAAILDSEQLQSLHQEMKKELEFVRERMKKYYDKGRLKGPILERGDMAYLLRKNIKTTRPSDKLDYKKLGPFKIEERISENNYRLSLPSAMKMKHPIFHVSLLEPAGDTIVVNPRMDIEVYEEDYEVEKILDKKRINGETKYLVKWKNYGEEDNSWEPTRHLKGAQRLLQQYHQQTKD